jgi:hypothetical protein
MCEHVVEVVCYQVNTTAGLVLIIVQAAIELGFTDTQLCIVLDGQFAAAKGPTIHLVVNFTIMYNFEDMLTLFHVPLSPSQVSMTLFPFLMFSNAGKCWRFHGTCKPLTVLPCKGTIWSTCQPLGLLL